jgi:cytoskeletal protein CcmA (bactofilin family)
MLRIGKNPKESVENETPAGKQEVPAYTTPRSFSSYQTPATETNPQPEYAAATPKAVTESEALAREIKEGNLSGFVGSGTVVTGEANFKAMMRVDGHLSGRINSSAGTLIVGSNGKVDANIEVANAIIHGTVNGDIIATQRLELGRAARLNGNIQTPCLIVEQGAIFEGTSKMIKMTANADKNKSNGRDVQPLDTTRMKPANVDGVQESTEMAEVANVSSVAS